MKRILVPIDFSEPSQTAVTFAERIARKAKATVSLLHVVELVQGESFNLEGEVSGGMEWMDKLYTMKAINRAKEKLEQTAADLRSNKVQVETTLRLGDAVHAIRAVAAKRNPDLIVMGTVGRTGVDAAVHGSTTQKVIRFAKCPVLTVHAGSNPSEGRDIVFATSMRKDELVFGEKVLEAQKIFGSAVHLLYVNTPEAFNTDRVIMKYLNDFAKRLRIQNYTVNIFNDHTTGDGILHFADSISADMIAMATHRRSSMSHLLLGKSIAESVARRAVRPVLTLAVD